MWERKQAEEQAEENGFPIYTQESNYDDNSDDGSSYDDSSYNDNTYDDQQDNSDQEYDNTDNEDGSSDTGNDDQTSGDESGDDSGDDSSDQIDYPVDDTTVDNTDGSLDGTEEDNYDNAEQITYWSDINKGSGYWCFMNWLVTGALFIYQQITEITSKPELWIMLFR